MPLQVFFGDDEHTAKDGPYPRLMKTRKWLYVSAGAAAVLALQLYDEAAAHEAVKVLHLPWNVLMTTTALGLAYLTVQYGLLTAQLLATYDITLKEKLEFRREGELAAARDVISERQKALSEYRDARPQPDYSAVKSAERKVDSAREDLNRTLQSDDTGSNLEAMNLPATMLDQLKDAAKRSKLLDIQRGEVTLATATQALKSAQDAVVKRLEELELPDPVYHSLRVSVADAESAQDAILGDDPARRWGYKKSEIAIDALRIAVPAIVALGSFLNLLIAAVNRT